MIAFLAAAAGLFIGCAAGVLAASLAGARRLASVRLQLDTAEKRLEQMAARRERHLADLEDVVEASRPNPLADSAVFAGSDIAALSGVSRTSVAAITWPPEHLPLPCTGSPRLGEPLADRPQGITAYPPCQRSGKDGR